MLLRGRPRKLVQKPADNCKGNAGPTTENVIGQSLFKLESRIKHYLLRAKAPVASWSADLFVELSSLANTIRNAADALLDPDDQPFPANDDVNGGICREGLKKIKERAHAARKLLVKQRFIQRSRDWIKRVQSNWKQNGAKAFFRFLNNDSKVPRASFANQQNCG